MNKEIRIRIIKPYIDQLKKANKIIDDLKDDSPYLKHLEKIRIAEKEASDISNKLFDLLQNT
jgi:hypothetical protein